jgi:hypothetical protein
MEVKERVAAYQERVNLLEKLDVKNGQLKLQQN